MIRAKRRRLRVQAYRALRLLRCHCLTLTSFLVVGAVATIALTSHDFVVASGSARDNTPIEGPITAVTDALTPSAVAQHPLALVYLVTSEEQASRLDLTYSSLIWDTVLTDPNYESHTRPIHVLIAGTPKEESDAIQQLNNLIRIADAESFDLRIVDLRPDK